MRSRTLREDRAAYTSDMTSPIIRKAQTGEPTTNTGHFGTHDHSSPESSLGRPVGTYLAGAEVPVCSPAGLTHVGTLNLADKGGDSYEGQGLSVSQHPEDWAAIAELSGQTWAIGGEDPVFLNYHELTAGQKDAITQWGIANGYVTVQPAWKVTYEDTETDEQRYFIVMDRQEAEVEADENEGAISETSTIVATGAFPDSTVHEGEQQVEDVLATVWVNEVATDFDGVWWADTYAPWMLSAPRGVIVPRAVDAWVATAAPAEG